MRFYLLVFIFVATKLLVADAVCYPCAPNAAIVCVNQTAFGVCDGGYVEHPINCLRNYNCVPVPANNTVTCRPITPTQFCSSIRATGRYPPIPPDPTCRTYILCTVTGTVWTGVVYTCPGTTFYNPTSRLCEVTPPPGCRATG